MKMTSERSAWDELEKLGEDWDTYGRLIKAILNKDGGVDAFNTLAEEHFPKGCTSFQFMEWCKNHQHEIGKDLKLVFDEERKVWSVRYSVRLAESYEIEADTEEQAIAELKRRIKDSSYTEGNLTDMEIMSDEFEAEFVFD